MRANAMQTNQPPHGDTNETAGRGSYTGSTDCLTRFPRKLLKKVDVLTT